MTICPEHDRSRLIEYDLRIDHPHQVNHPQVITLVPGTVVVDGSGLGVRLGAGVYQRVGTQAIVGNPQPRLVGLREARKL